MYIYWLWFIWGEISLNRLTRKKSMSQNIKKNNNKEKNSRISSLKQPILQISNNMVEPMVIILHNGVELRNWHAINHLFMSVKIQLSSWCVKKFKNLCHIIHISHSRLHEPLSYFETPLHIMYNNKHYKSEKMWNIVV